MTREQASKAVDPGCLRPYLPIDGYIISWAFESIRRRILGDAAVTHPTVVVYNRDELGKIRRLISFRVHLNDRYPGGGGIERIPIWD